MLGEIVLKSDTNQAVQPQMTRGLKFGINDVDGLFYVAKTKAPTSCAVTAQRSLTASLFTLSHEVAHIQLVAFNHWPVTSFLDMKRLCLQLAIEAQMYLCKMPFFCVLFELLLYIHDKQLVMSERSDTNASLLEAVYQYLVPILSPVTDNIRI